MTRGNKTRKSMAAKVKGVPRKLDVSRTPGQPKRRKKITLVFDEEKRREFLGGFHKRKVQRQKRAQEELQRQLKEEKKKIKQDARERYKKLLSRRDIPELEELLSKEEYEVEGRTVSILEVNVADLAEKANWIGQNKVTYEGDEDTEKQNEEQADEDGDEMIAGMELTVEPKQKNRGVQAPTSMDFGTKKEVKRAVKRAALKQVQKSKAFKLKQRLERQKNKKQSMQQKRRNEKIVKKREGQLKKRNY
ncbi:nucleolar protein 12 [Cephus cinctus]|uniref:Nucleolar protein 12 n=1 Tax=Cephus cinctus TaxID=211228 RepID=A0AAJ7FVI1_CEPCN|nr:nucleolar protein 12 [Cephus cinctus]